MTASKRFVMLSGPSCVGKGPLQAAVRKFHPGLIDARPILCTSRPPRKSEIHGEDFYFLPEDFIRSLAGSPDFAVSPVRTDWQAIHIPQVKELLRTRDVVFAEVFHTFGTVLRRRAASRQFKSIRVFLLPLPPETSHDEVIRVMKAKLRRRATDTRAKIADRSSSAPKEIKASASYTHRIVNSVGEDDVAEWKSLGTCGGKKGKGAVRTIRNLGPCARWLVRTFVRIVRGRLPPGDYSYPSNAAQ